MVRLTRVLIAVLVIKVAGLSAKDQTLCGLAQETVIVLHDLPNELR